jgi:hypothetical protein
VGITAWCIDPITGKHLWAERHDRPMGEIFEVQNKMTLAIVGAMQVSHAESEQARLIGKDTTKLDGSVNSIKTQQQFYLMDRSDSKKSKEFAKEAVSLDPNSVFLYTSSANSHMLKVRLKFTKFPK